MLILTPITTTAQANPLAYMPHKNMGLRKLNIAILIANAVAAHAIIVLHTMTMVTTD